MLVALQSRRARRAVNTPPATPGNFTATPSASFVTLTWQDVAGETSYRLEITGTNGHSSALTLSAGATSQGFSGTNGVTYFFSLRAENSFGVSSWATASATPILILSPPSISAVAASSTSIDVSWTSVVDAQSYDLEMATTPGEFSYVISTSGATAYTVTSLTPSTTYYFRVRAFHPESISEWAETSAQTPGE